MMSENSATLTLSLIVQDMNRGTTGVGTHHMVLDRFASFEKSSARVKWTAILIASSRNNVLALPIGEWNRHRVVAPAMLSESLCSLECLGGTSRNIASF